MNTLAIKLYISFFILQVVDFTTNAPWGSIIDKSISIAVLVWIVHSMKKANAATAIAHDKQLKDKDDTHSKQLKDKDDAHTKHLEQVHNSYKEIIKEMLEK